MGRSSCRGFGFSPRVAILLLGLCAGNILVYRLEPPSLFDGRGGIGIGGDLATTRSRFHSQGGLDTVTVAEGADDSGHGDSYSERDEETETETNSNGIALTSLTSVILPPAAETIKRGGTPPLVLNGTAYRDDDDLVAAAAAFYRISDDSDPSRTSKCSCQNASSKGRCCWRKIDRYHKMGVVFFRDLGNSRAIPFRYLKTLGDRLNLAEKIPDRDFRVVLTTRNVYDAVVSGYLYHQAGMECWLGLNGEPKDHKNMRNWTGVISYEPEPPDDGRSICRYLADESEEVGLRVMIEWSFRHHYRKLVGNLALLSKFPSFLGGRIRPICFSDYAYGEGGNRVRAIRDAFQFLDNGNNFGERRARNFVDKADPGKHGTSTDPVVRSRLLSLVKKIDEELYNGDIAWMESFLPCQ